MVDAERLARVEVNQQNLSDAMRQMAVAQSEMAATLTRVSVQNEEIQRIQQRQASSDHRLTVLEGDVKALNIATAPLAGLSNQLTKNTMITSAAVALSGFIASGLILAAMRHWIG